MVRPRVVGSRACWVKKRIEGKGSQSRICLTLWHGKKPHSLFLRLLPTIKLVHPNHRERERERVIIKYETLVWVFGGSHSFLFFRLILLFFLLLLRFFFGFWLKSLGFFFWELEDVHSFHAQVFQGLLESAGSWYPARQYPVSFSLYALLFLSSYSLLLSYALFVFNNKILIHLKNL